MVPTCRELGIGIISYCPLGRGFLCGIFKREKLVQTDFRIVISTPSRCFPHISRVYMLRIHIRGLCTVPSINLLNHVQKKLVLTLNSSEMHFLENGRHQKYPLNL